MLWLSVARNVKNSSDYVIDLMVLEIVYVKHGENGLVG